MNICRVGAGVLLLGIAGNAAHAIEPLAGQLTCVASAGVPSAVDHVRETPVFGSFLEADLSFGAVQETHPTTQPTTQPTSRPGTGDQYVGGRGLITTEGPTGMFLNPTSGTARKGDVTAQYCLAFLKAPGGATNTAHGAIVSYGVTDWLEVGGVGLVVDLDDVNHNVGIGGPFFRLRLLKEESWWPELSVGAVGRYGYRVLESQSIFVAASKHCEIDRQGFFRAFRTHLGFRQRWQDSSFGVANASIVYLGGELELPWDIFIVGEISNKDDLYNRTPFSFGVQLRSSRLRMSVAGIQTGFEEQVSLYAGIGIDS